MTNTWDVIVIGGGPAGENVADGVVRGGLTAVIVESELVGGECSYWACMPSKALLRSPEALRAAQHVAGVTGGSLDVAAVLARRDSFASDWTDRRQVDWLDSAGVDLVRGHGRLTAEREVTVTTGNQTRTLHARRAVVLSTGTRAKLPTIPGLDDAAPWTSREATSAQEVPRSLAIIGGGVVAAEMACAHAQLGAQVTVLARSGLLTSMEPFVGELVAEGLTGLGVDVRTGANPVRVGRDDAGVVIDLDNQEQVRASEVLVATGRTPNSDRLGLEVLGLAPDGPVEADDTLLVSGTDWLYAVGDINGRAMLTHQGKYQARIAGEAIVARAGGNDPSAAPWSDTAATADHSAVPQVVFTSPEVASVGATLAAARTKGLPVREVDHDLGAIAGASLYEDGYRGRARLVVDTDREVIVGATFVGPGVAELVHAATIAIVGEVPMSRLWHAVPAYPTISEIWLRLLETYRQ